MPAMSPGRAPDFGTMSVLDIGLHVRPSIELMAEFSLPGEPKDDRPVSERVLDAVLSKRLSQGQVIDFDPRADYFLDLQVEAGTRFQDAALADVRKDSSLALPAALTGVRLDPGLKAQAAEQLKERLDEYQAAFDAALERMLARHGDSEGR